MQQLPEALPCPVPGQFEEAVAWPAGEDARWVSACWTSSGDTVWLSDGRTSLTGSGWGFLAWKRHAAVAPHLADADLGSSDLDGTAAVLLDRVSRRCYVVEQALADRILKSQWPAVESITLTAGELEELIDRLQRASAARPMPSPQAVIAAMQRHSQAVAALIAALDEWLASRQNGEQRGAD